jgi:hypothetical protein
MSSMRVFKSANKKLIYFTGLVMSKNPESRYTDKVHRRIKKLFPNTAITRMAMMMGSTAGIADFLYEGKGKHTKGAIWVEYKHIPSWSGKRKLPVNKISVNQINFLTERIELGRPCALIFGDEKGLGYILKNDRIIHTPDCILNMGTAVTKNIISPEEIASWINSQIE